MLTDDDIYARCQDELGDLSSLITLAKSTAWFNAGQSRMTAVGYPTEIAVEWDEEDNDLTDYLEDFLRMDRFVYAENVPIQEFVIYNNTMVVRAVEGATAEGSGILYYEATWPLVTASEVSWGSFAHNEACISYVLYRFFKGLSSSRLEYRRYANLVGANVVGIEDLQAEADRHYQEFLDGRDDVVPHPPVSAYGG